MPRASIARTSSGVTFVAQVGSVGLQPRRDIGRAPLGLAGFRVRAYCPTHAEAIAALTLQGRTCAAHSAQGASACDSPRA